MGTYYVSKLGSDSYTGGLGDTWLTIRASVAKLVAGDILLVRTGTYVETVEPGGSGGIGWVSGSVGNQIEIRAYGSTETSTKGVSAGTEAVIIKPSSGNGLGFNKNDLKYLYLHGFVIDGANSSSGTGLGFNNDANNITIRHMEIKNWPDDGVSGSTSNGSATTDRNNLLQYLYIHNCGTLHSGVGKHGIYWRSRGSIFEHLDCANNDVAGIQFYNSGTSSRYAHNCIVRYCILRDNQTDYHFQQVGLSIGPNMDNLKVHNNLIYAHRDAGIDFATEGGNSTNHKLYNNTIVDIGNSGGNGKNGIRATFTGHSGVQVKNNLIWDTVGTPIVDTYGLFSTANNYTSTSVNPNFAGYSRGSAWNLALTGSTPDTIRTGGLDLGSEYYEDFAGATRASSFSMGAYSSGASPASPEDPVLEFPSPFLVTFNATKMLDGFGISDINVSEVGNYTFDVAVTEGTLNDGT